MAYKDDLPDLGVTPILGNLHIPHASLQGPCNNAEYSMIGVAVTQESANMIKPVCGRLRIMMDELAGMFKNTSIFSKSKYIKV